MIKRTTLITLIVATFATAAPASAQTGNAYGGEGNVLGEVTQGTGQNGGGTSGNPAGTNGPAVAPNAVNQVAATNGSSLPFTGFDVLLLVAGGIVLVGVGATLRRLTATAYE